MKAARLYAFGIDCTANGGCVGFPLDYQNFF
jgi:hypothetical protein